MDENKGIALHQAIKKLVDLLADGDVKGLRFASHETDSAGNLIERPLKGFRIENGLIGFESTEPGRGE